MNRAALQQLLADVDAAVPAGPWVFLCDPAAGQVERQQTDTLLAQVRAATTDTENGWLAIRTGGTTGTVKFARHDERTLVAAARGFSAHFGLARVNAVNVLPLHHVSGLLARVRCAVTGGTHLPWDWKRLEAGDRPVLLAGDWVISLVPTQLQRLLAAPAAVEWLRGFRVILLGGGPTWPALAEAAARAELRIALSYGMTETAAMVAAQRPEEFLAGDRTCGRALPHAQIMVTADGRIAVAGDSLFRGYVGGPDHIGALVTEDLGALDAQGRLQVLGRRDAAIISGGEKVHAADVEAALRASGEFSDVAVLGLPDAQWGEVVVACYPVGGRAPDLARAVAALAPAQRPKQFFALASWPRNELGKLHREELRRAAAAARAGAATGRTQG